MFLKLLVQTWFACEGCGVKKVSSEFRYGTLLLKCGSQTLVLRFACASSRKWSDSDLPELQGQPAPSFQNPAKVTHLNLLQSRMCSPLG